MSDQKRDLARELLEDLQSSGDAHRIARLVNSVTLGGGSLLLTSVSLIVLSFVWSSGPSPTSPPLLVLVFLAAAGATGFFSLNLRARRLLASTPKAVELGVGIGDLPAALGAKLRRELMPLRAGRPAP